LENTKKRQTESEVLFFMWGILVSAISGALMSVQGVFNAETTKQTSVWLSASFVQITAFFVCLLAWFLTGKEGTIGSLFQVTPKYILLGGAIGAFITFTVIYSVNALGPARSAVFIVSTQLLVSYLLELFGLFGVERQPFEWRKGIGIIVMIVGIITFKWK
jgi:transporter family-2 protein